MSRLTANHQFVAPSTEKGSITVVNLEYSNLIYLQKLLDEGSCLIVMPFAVKNMYFIHLKNVIAPMPSTNEFKQAIKNGSNIIASPDIVAEGINYGAWDNVILFECDLKVHQIHDSLNFTTMADRVLHKSIMGRINEMWNTYIIPQGNQIGQVHEAMRYYADFQTKAMGQVTDFTYIN